VRRMVLAQGGRFHVKGTVARLSDRSERASVHGAAALRLCIQHSRDRQNSAGPLQ
jgi:hypothetical protein